MCSINPRIFNLIDKNNTVVFRSIIDEKTKILHAKSISKRKKMVESVAGVSSFNHPRNKDTVQLLYQLAEGSSRTTAIYKSSSDPYLIGYISFLLSLYSPKEKKTECINNSIQWLTQALEDKKWSGNSQLSQLYYFLFLSYLLLNNEKGVSAIFKKFSELIETQPSKIDELDLNAPRFWFQQTEKLFQLQNDNKSLEPAF
jgi:hypothetical protein